MAALLLQGLGWAGTGGEASLVLQTGRHAAEACLSSCAKFGPQLACLQQWGNLAWAAADHACFAVQCVVQQSFSCMLGYLAVVAQLRRLLCC